MAKLLAKKIEKEKNVGEHRVSANCDHKEFESPIVHQDENTLQTDEEGV